MGNIINKENTVTLTTTGEPLLLVTRTKDGSGFGLQFFNTDSPNGGELVTPQQRAILELLAPAVADLLDGSVETGLPADAVRQVNSQIACAVAE